jgi:PAS domain S-box-containing protein
MIEIEKLLVDSIAVALIAMTPEGKILFWNSGSETAFGYSAAHATGKMFADLLAPRELTGDIQDIVQETLRKQSFSCNAFLNRKDHSQIQAHIDLRVISDRSENIIVVSCSEIRMNDQTGSSSEMNFLAKMSHDLRSPLNAIIGFSELLLNGRCGDLNEKQRAYLTDILESGRSLLNQMNELFDLMKGNV